MAYWILPFKSKGGTEYEIQIGGADTNRVLTAGAVPIVTQEDNSDDFFKPVRTQSGYIQIVDQLIDGSRGFVWTDIMPADAVSRPVYLMQGVNVLWRGYLQPQSFSGQWKEAVQIRQYPIVCCLSALAAYDVGATAADIVNFGWVLYYIFTRNSAFANSNFYFAGEDAVNEWLFKQVQWSNFVEIDSDGVPQSKYNCLELLQQICTFFGWTCRMYKQDVYFCSADVDFDTDWTYINMQDLDSIANETPVQYLTQNWSTYANILSAFADNNNQLTFRRGIKTAEVTAQVSPLGDILNVDFGTIQSIIEKESGSVSQVEQGGTYYFTKYGLLDGYENDQYNLTLTWNQGDIRAQLYLYDEYDGDLSLKHNYNWKCYLRVNDGSDEYAARLTSKHLVALDHGIISISAGTESSSNGYMTCRLKIGSMYWDGGAWVTTPSTFNISFGDEANPSATDVKGAIISNRLLASSWPSFEGHGVPVNGSIGGYMQFDIVSVYTTASAGQRVVRLTDLAIGFTRFNAFDENSNRDNNVYKAESGHLFRDNDSRSTIFATDNNNQAGAGIILNENGSYCSGITYTLSGGIATLRPEQELADRIAEAGATTKKMFEVHLRSNLLPSISPAYKVTADSMPCWPLVISRNWRDDITTFKLIEL